MEEQEPNQKEFISGKKVRMSSVDYSRGIQYERKKGVFLKVER